MPDTDQLAEATEMVLESAGKLAMLVNQSLLSGSASLHAAAIREQCLDVRASYLTYLYTRDNPEEDS